MEQDSKDEDSRTVCAAMSEGMRGLNLEARLKAHGWHLPVAGIIEDFVPGEITVIAEHSILMGTNLIVEISAFAFVGEVLSCRSRDERTHEIHISIKDTDTTGLRRTPRFPVNLPARVFTSSLAAPLAATITDISGDGLGLETTVSLPNDASLVIESQSNIALGVVKHCREVLSQRYRIGVRLHHIITSKPEGGGAEPRPRKTRWLSFVPKRRHG